MDAVRINVSCSWDLAPPEGRFEFDRARVRGGGINVGWGTYDKETRRFAFTSTDEFCRLCFGLDTEGARETGTETVLRVVDTPTPFQVRLAEVLNQPEGTWRLPEAGATIVAEVDWFAML